MRVVRDRIGLDDGGETLRGELVRADVEVGLPQRLEDGRLAGLERESALEQHRRGTRMAVGEHA